MRTSLSSWVVLEEIDSQFCGSRRIRKRLNGEENVIRFESDEKESLEQDECG